MLKKKLFFPLMMIFMLALSACGDSNQGAISEAYTLPVIDKTSDNPKTLDIPGTPDATVRQGEITLTPMEAFDKYIEKYPNTKVEEISLDRNFGSYVYKVEGYDGEKEYKLKISAVDGSIVEENIEKDNDYKNKGEITKTYIEKIESLVSQALEDAGKGAELDQWSLEINDGIVILEVEIDLNGSDDIEYKYNVESGELIEKDR